MINPMPLSLRPVASGLRTLARLDLKEETVRRLVEGAIIFDVDETLLEVTVDHILHRQLEEALADSHALPVLAELLIKGFKLCAVTGNDLAKFAPRFSAPLRAYLAARDALGAMERLEVYGNGAATHITFGPDGREIADHAYNDLMRIADPDHGVIVAVLTEVADWTADRFLAKEDLERDHDLTTWAYPYDPATRRWQTKEGQEVHRVPFVSSRGDRAMVALKPVPSHKHLRIPGGRDIRALVVAEINKRLHTQLGERARLYAVGTGGWSTIEVTRGVSKATGVKHYLERHRLTPEQAVYLANEFRPDGNDQPVLDGIHGIGAISINQPIEEVFHLSNVVWGGGRGVHSAEHQLTDILERFEAAALAARLRPQDAENIVPVIRDKLLDAFDQKIADRRRLLDRLAMRTHTAQIKLRREMVCLMDRTLRGLQDELMTADHSGE